MLIFDLQPRDEWDEARDAELCLLNLQLQKLQQLLLQSEPEGRHAGVEQTS